MNDASHCTIELLHGGRVHVGLTPGEVSEMVRQARRKWRQVPTPRGSLPDSMAPDPDTFIVLPRIKNDPDIPRAARGFSTDFRVDACAVIAIFPLDQGSVIPERH